MSDRGNNNISRHGVKEKNVLIVIHRGSKTLLFSQLQSQTVIVYSLNCNIHAIVLVTPQLFFIETFY